MDKLVAEAVAGVAKTGKSVRNIGIMQLSKEWYLHVAISSITNGTTQSQTIAHWTRQTDWNCSIGRTRGERDGILSYSTSSGIDHEELVDQLLLAIQVAIYRVVSQIAGSCERRRHLVEGEAAILDLTSLDIGLGVAFCEEMGAAACRCG